PFSRHILNGSNLKTNPLLITKNYMPINIISSFYIEPCSIYFYHEGMKPANAGALRFWWYFQRDSYAVLSDLHNTIPFMLLNSFMVNQKGYIFFTMKACSLLAQVH